MLGTADQNEAVGTRRTVSSSPGAWKAAKAPEARARAREGGAAGPAWRRLCAARVAALRGPRGGSSVRPSWQLRAGPAWWLCGARRSRLGARWRSPSRRRRRSPFRGETAPARTARDKPGAERSRGEPWLCPPGSALRPTQLGLPTGVVNAWRVERIALPPLLLPSVPWVRYPKQLGGRAGPCMRN